MCVYLFLFYVINDALEEDLVVMFCCYKLQHSLLDDNEYTGTGAAEQVFLGEAQKISLL